MDLAPELPRFHHVAPPAPKPWEGVPPLWRRMLQLRRSALPTWGPGAYDGWIFQGPFLGRQSFLLNDPDGIKHVLVDNPGNYGRTPAAIRILHPMIGNGLFLSEGTSWKFQRRTAAPAFAPRSLDHLAQVSARRSASLEATMEQGSGLENLLTRMQRLALGIAGETLFSQAMEDYADELRVALERYGRRVARPSPLDFLLGPDTPSPMLSLRRRIGRDYATVIERIIAERGRQAPGERPTDLFEALRAARDPETGRGFSNEELRDQVATLVIAGHETTALSLFWSFYLLALAPDVQEAVAAEAAGLRLDEENIGSEFPKLALAKAVVQEALRLYPPAYSIVRMARKADQLPSREGPPVPVPQGALVVIAPWVLHRHKQLWNEPGRFDPTRFLPGAPPPSRFGYLPFGAGPRVCIGAQFALTEAAIILARITRAFSITIPHGRRVLPVGVVTVYPDRAPAFRLRKREHALHGTGAPSPERAAA